MFTSIFLHHWQDRISFQPYNLSMISYDSTLVGFRYQAYPYFITITCHTSFAANMRNSVVNYFTGEDQVAVVSSINLQLSVCTPVFTSVIKMHALIRLE